MKLASIQIEGFGYLDHVVLTGNETSETRVVVHLKDHDNPKEDIWLQASVTAEISDYIKKELLLDIRKGSAVLADFRADYTGFSEVFYPPNEPNERMVIFKAHLTTIHAVYINGHLKSGSYKQQTAV